MINSRIVYHRGLLATIKDSIFTGGSNLLPLLKILHKFLSSYTSSNSKENGAFNKILESNIRR